MNPIRNIANIGSILRFFGPRAFRTLTASACHPAYAGSSALPDGLGRLTKVARCHPKYHTLK
jgi:hypothetical protein